MKKAISLMIVFVLLVSTISAVSLNSYASNNIIGSYGLWNYHADTFGGGTDYFHLKGTPTGSILSCSNSTTGAISFTATSPNNGVSDWYPTVTVNSPSMVLFDENDEISVKFYLNNNMTFGDYYGYNGCVSLAFYLPNEFAGADQKSTALPDNLHLTSYEWTASSFWGYNSNSAYHEVGGLGANVYEAGSAGIIVNLYPGISGANANTRNASHYKISNIVTANSYVYNSVYDPGTGINAMVLQNGNQMFDGNFQSAIDLGQETTIKIKRDTTTNTNFTFYKVYINGSLTQTLSAANGTDMRSVGEGLQFSMNVTGSVSSSLVSSPASFTLTKINDVAAGVYPSMCGFVIDRSHTLNFSNLPYNTYNQLYVYNLLYNYYYLPAIQKQWYEDLGELPILAQMLTWYTTGYGIPSF